MGQADFTTNQTLDLMGQLGCMDIEMTIAKVKKTNP